MNNDQLVLMMLDYPGRIGLQRLPPDGRQTGRTLSELDGPRTLALLTLPENSVIVLMSNNEERATEAWKMLVAQNVVNVYILEGGINHWLDVFGHEGHEDCVIEDTEGGQKRLATCSRRPLAPINREPIPTHT